MLQFSCSIAKKFILLLAFLLTSCTAGVELSSTLVPPPDIWRIAYTPEIAWLVDRFDPCLDLNSRVGIAIEESYNMQVAGSNADILLHWGDIDPQGFKAYLIGTDYLDVIVNYDNPLQEMTIEDLKKIYEGNITNWGAFSPELSGKITAWVYSDHLNIQQKFNESVVDPTSSLSSFNIVPDVSAMLEAIQTDPGAIGFIPAHWPSDTVKRIGLLGWDIPQVPVIWVSKEDPGEEQFEWITCIKENFH